MVAASGPSLNEEIAQACAGLHVIAVNDAYRLFPFADVLYACDGSWWDLHSGCLDFKGERWSSHGNKTHNEKLGIASRYGLKLISGRDAEGFSLDPNYIHYGGNSGFQAVNLAIHFLGGAGRIVLVGFDMRIVGGKRHFFGNHPATLMQTSAGYKAWPKQFERAAKMLPKEIEIMNATPGSAMQCFPMVALRDAIEAF